jgi:uncharacterized protein Yka (UPF0111/DUF47 family)
MSAKIEILEELGESALLLPQRINRALAANDRIKYFLTLFQSARDHADHPNTPAQSLQRERVASGVEDASFDAVVSSTTRDGSLLHMPQAARLHALVVAGLREMLEPVKWAASGDASKEDAYGHYHGRFDQLLASAPPFPHDRVSVEYIDAMARGRGDQDSLHLLVMDLHRELNQLQRSFASETVEGADVYGIGETDRRLVAAFMAGVNRTSFLKFDHPGLGTSATRMGDRLVIQNDIGTTDNHVLVLHVTGLTLTVTYTDVHRARLVFFQTLLEPVGFTWTATPAPGSSAAYQLSVGQVACRDEEELQRHLTVVGSRLVFLIDWNRARKRLSRFVKKSDAIEVLHWAADHEVGHRAFLQIGDVRLVYTAMERAARAQIRVGARLDEMLGRESAKTFLEAVLRLTAEGLRDHKSLRLIQDEIHAELLTHFQSSEQGALALAADHASLVAALAGLVRDALGRSGAEADASDVLGFAARAKAWESRADQIVSRSRTVGEQAAGDRVIARLLSEADDVADGLEEAAFLLTLAPAARASHSCLTVLRELADLMTSGAQGYVKCVESARDAHRLGIHDDVEDLLIAVDAVIAFEHQSDERERTVKAQLLDLTQDFRELHVLSEVAGCLGDSADGLARCALIVRDYVLEALNAR